MTCTRPHCGGRILADLTCMLCARPIPAAQIVPLPLVNDGAHTRRKAVSKTAKVASYVEAHQGKTATEIADALETDDAEVRKTLAGLMSAGMLDRRGEGGQLDPYRWHLASEEEEASA